MQGRPISACALRRAFLELFHFGVDFGETYPQRGVARHCLDASTLHCLYNLQSWDYFDFETFRAIQDVLSCELLAVLKRCNYLGPQVVFPASFSPQVPSFGCSRPRFQTIKRLAFKCNHQPRQNIAGGDGRVGAADGRMSALPRVLAASSRASVSAINPIARLMYLRARPAHSAAAYRAARGVNMLNCANGWLHPQKMSSDGSTEPLVANYAVWSHPVAHCQKGIKWLQWLLRKLANVRAIFILDKLLVKIEGISYYSQQNELRAIQKINC
ncbi:hypothetical protein DFH09DRAFT_1084644 [Mycena vulgaris]|nr:hypothetical protein DFH09DRAFT_1084644 [Mycena vulgaris]